MSQQKIKLDIKVPFSTKVANVMHKFVIYSLMTGCTLLTLNYFSGVHYRYRMQQKQLAESEIKQVDHTLTTEK